MTPTLIAGTAWGHDEAVWTATSAIVTALATIVALLAAFGFFEWLKRPRLVLAPDEARAFSSKISGHYHVRIPVKNVGKNHALQVEVLLQAVILSDGSIVSHIIPTRLNWVHSAAIASPYIARGGFHLLNIGYAETYMGEDWVPPPGATDDDFHFDGESPQASTRTVEAEGSVWLMLLISALNHPAQITYVKLTFNLGGETPGMPPIIVAENSHYDIPRRKFIWPPAEAPLHPTSP